MHKNHGFSAAIEHTLAAATPHGHYHKALKTSMAFKKREKHPAESRIFSPANKCNSKDDRKARRKYSRRLLMT
jgi:hypothetical protein